MGKLLLHLDSQIFQEQDQKNLQFLRLAGAFAERLPSDHPLVSPNKTGKLQHPFSADYVVFQQNQSDNPTSKQEMALI